MEMKMNCGFEGDGDKGMYLPPGFRFHPTDEELIAHYLIPKAMDSNFMARAMGEVDLNKCEPWDLPKKAKIGEKEWYFFTIRDRKYPTGMRTNRATEAGYWKATGKDKEIYNKQKSLVGMKKTLVFYKGRAPKGQKSNWVMHEYRLHGNLLTTSKNEWVICRVFHKSSGAKKSPFPSLVKSDSCQNEFMPNGLPPLMEPSPYSSIDDRGGEGGSGQTIPRPLNMSCSSNLNIAMGLSSHETFNSFINYHAFGAPNPIPTYPNPNGPLRGSYMSGSQDTGLSNEMNGENSSVISNYEIGRQSFDHDPKGPSSSGGPIDLDVLWNY